MVQKQRFPKPRHLANLILLILRLPRKKHFLDRKKPRHRFRMGFGDKHSGALAKGHGGEMLPA
jgi:hypothetical protein